MIWDNIHHLVKSLDVDREFGLALQPRFGVDFMPCFVCSSGGFDCLHVGHLRCIQESRRFGTRLIIIVNGDGFLIRKKGFVFMPLAERMEIIAGLAGVHDVVAWDDGTQNVVGALELLRPHVFTKGGDRSSPAQMNPEEIRVCESIGCRIEYGVGGNYKAQSSSKLTEKLQHVVGSR